MAEKLEKSIPWITILAICFMVAFGSGIILKEVLADAVIPTVEVGNVAPTIGAIILNGGIAITVTENTTVTVAGTTTITDSNTYSDITSVTSTLYLNNTTTCGTSDANWCYSTNWVSCATSNCSGNSCDVSCTANVWFIAEPSDASSTYPTKAWQMDITVVDSGSNATSGTTSQELNTASYMDVSSTISYLCGGGNCSPGATSSESEINATNTGNWPIDIQLSGVDMESTATSIDVGRQKYSTDTSMGDWDGTALTEGAVTLDVVMAKPTATTSNSVDSIYWMIKIPDPQSPGTYTGPNTAGVIWAAL